MPQKKTMVWIRDARYYPEQHSIAIVAEDVETRKPITQQVLVKDFIKAYNLSAKEDDIEAWKFFASQLRARTEPCPLLWLGTKTEADPI